MPKRIAPEWADRCRVRSAPDSDIIGRMRHQLEGVGRIARAGVALARRHWKPLAVLSTCALAWLVYLDRQVEGRFQSELLPTASRIYSRPILLKSGFDVQRRGLVEHLRRVGYRELEAPPVGVGEFAQGRGEIVIGRRPFAYVEGLAEGGVVEVAYDRRGRVTRLRGESGRLDHAWIEPEVIGSFYGEHWVDRRPLLLEVYPQHLIDALLSMEDRRFYEHSGLDLRRIAGAAVANLRAGRVTQGGSTLTQQLVKNLYLSHERSLMRKLREAPMALLLELHHGKDEILEAYLNEIYLGQRGPVAIHGMGAAARHYFGKDASGLTLSESAFLVGLIHGPGLYSPHHRPAAAKARRDRVLAVLVEQSLITEDAHRVAVAQPVSVHTLGAYQNPAPYFLSSLRRHLESGYGAQELEVGGYTILTTLDPVLQRLARHAVQTGLEDLERRHEQLRGGESPVQAALVAIHPPTGDILAMVGGRDFGSSQWNRADQARRQPGSAFKPIVALAALTAGETGGPAYTLASVLEDRPLRIETRTGDWTPANYSGKFQGQVTFREAIEQSLNVPIALAGLEIGADRVADVAARLGIESSLNRVPSLVLGSSEVSLLELTGAYAVLAAEGMRHEPASIRSVFDGSGGLVQERSREAQRVATPEEAYLVTSALRGAVDRGTGRGLRAAGYRGDVAGKTGTTNDYHDAWFVGYTPELAIGVWVGFDDNRELGLTGAEAALPIFAQVLTGALGPDGRAEFHRPSGLERVRVNPELGLRAGWGCPGERELFLSGTSPTEYCGKRGFVDWLRSRF